MARTGHLAKWLSKNVDDVNDAILGTAGVFEGFDGAGASTHTLVIAGVATTLAGAIALAGLQYASGAAEGDEYRKRLDEEKRQLALDPAAVHSEIFEIYRAQGLSEETAEQVADELSGTGALSAHADAELGVLAGKPPLSPVLRAVNGALAFVVGAFLPFVLLLIVNRDHRTELTSAVVLVFLCFTAWLDAEADEVGYRRRILRSLLIGAAALGASFLAGLALTKS